MYRMKAKFYPLIRILFAPLATAVLTLAFCSGQAAARQGAAATSTAPATAPTQPARKDDGMVWFGAPPAEDQKIIIGSPDPASDYLHQVEIVNRGAAVQTLKLSKYYATVADKKLANKYKGEHEKYLKKRYENPEKYKGHYCLLSPSGDLKDRRFYPDQFYPLATKAVEVRIAGNESASLSLENLHKKTWRLEKKTQNSATFSYTFYRGPRGKWEIARKNPVLKITKTYTVIKKDYSIRMDLKLENLSSVEISVRLNQAGPTGVPREDYRGDLRKAMYGVLEAENGAVMPVMKPIGELEDIEQKQKDDLPVVGTSIVTPEAPKPTLWLGHVNKFFGAMLHPIPASGDQLNAASLKAKFYVQAAHESPTSRTFKTGVVIPEIRLGPDESGDVNFSMYAGPKRTDIFDGGSPYFKPLYKKLNYKGTIQFGGCCTWEPLSFGMMWLLDTLSIVTLGNYGLAIILLVALVRVALHPLTRRSQKSMAKMQKLGPEMQKLKEKHKDDKETLNKEMMKFYKEQGASPFLGCLPMFLQMPIWIALWTGINASVALRHEGLLPVWITDLAAPDTLIGPWQTQIMFIGNRFNLLPILLGIAMYIQSKINPQMTGQSSATPEQQKQQQMMRVLMPVMMLFIFYSAPSGLTLYIMASTFAGAAEMYIIRKHIKEKEEIQAATETTVKAPGKAPRSKRPKKPKGPYWTKRG